LTFAVDFLPVLVILQAVYKPEEQLKDDFISVLRPRGCVFTSGRSLSDSSATAAFLSALAS